MSSLRYAVNEHGLMRPDPKGEFVPFSEWAKAIEAMKEAQTISNQLVLQNAQLRIDLAVALAERTP